MTSTMRLMQISSRKEKVLYLVLIAVQCDIVQKFLLHMLNLKKILFSKLCRHVIRFKQPPVWYTAVHWTAMYGEISYNKMLHFQLFFLSSVLKNWHTKQKCSGLPRSPFSLSTAMQNRTEDMLVWIKPGISFTNHQCQIKLNIVLQTLQTTERTFFGTLKSFKKWKMNN